MALLSPEERALYRGFAINKFRGDLSLFEDGVRILEERTSSPCLGVFPFAGDITLDAEDTLAIDTGRPRAVPPGARLAIVRLPCISNTTDFRLLDWAEWVTKPPAGDFDFVILPGSKSTIADLRWLRDVGLADWVVAQHRRAATVIGICGGFQMLGRTIRDPSRVESPDVEAAGLGLLPADTVLEAEKRTAVRTAWSRGGVRFGAYEIHLGATAVDPPAQPFARLDDGRTDGACLPGVIGTYLHGAFENADVCAETFGVPVSTVSKAEHYRRLGEWFSAHASRSDIIGG
jgi:adenosylcobyric acid synthase